MTRWVTRTGPRVAFAEAVLMTLALLNNDVDTLPAVADGGVSVFSLAALVFMTPEYPAIAGVVSAVTSLLPFLPRRNEATDCWEQAVTRH